MSYRNWQCVVAAAAAWMFASVANASGLDQLQAFLGGAKTGKTTFRQVVTGKSGRVPQESSGTFAFARPGKFRWSYDKPHPQIIVGDGEKLWIYDPDLNQVVVRKLDRALGATPAALLSGDDALGKNFELSDGGKNGDVEFVDAHPRAADSGFTTVRIGLKDNLPRTMELHDSFGQVTQLTFGSFERNASVDPGLFRFTPPAGADVVGE
ncbi:MAG TPA: outer membrane lipoprotein chaperone LolA [Casimicrobiaceae bacterium]|jgi:outer membrane lipoprotein carrier protein